MPLGCLQGGPEQADEQRADGAQARAALLHKLLGTEKENTRLAEQLAAKDTELAAKDDVIAAKDQELAREVAGERSLLTTYWSESTLSRWTGLASWEFEFPFSGGWR